MTLKWNYNKCAFVFYIVNLLYVQTIKISCQFFAFIILLVTQFGFYDDKEYKFIVVTVAGIGFWIITFKIKETPVNYLAQFSYSFLTYLLWILNNIIEPNIYRWHKLIETVGNTFQLCVFFQKIVLVMATKKQQQQ